MTRFASTTSKASVCADTRKSRRLMQLLAPVRAERGLDRQVDETCDQWDHDALVQRDSRRDLLGTLGSRMSGGPRQRASNPGAASAGVTSALRLHDATNAYLSWKHEVAKQPANEMVLKKIDKEYLDQRISQRWWAKSGIWPEDFCAPRIGVKATCSACPPELHMHYALENVTTAQGTSLGTTGHVDDFACHLLRAGACESDRWPPSKAAHQEASTKAESQEGREVRATRGGAERGADGRRRGPLSNAGHRRGGTQPARRTRGGATGG